MNEGTLQNIMAGSNNVNGSQRRRSPRFSSPPPLVNVTTDNNKMALVTVGVKHSITPTSVVKRSITQPTVGVKRSITVRKIAPRKTVAPSERNKENTPKKPPKVSTPDPVPGRGGSSSAKKKKEKKATILSPILPSSPPPSAYPQQPAADPEDAVWSQKVRRSYSRLSGNSFNTSPDSRETMFGFEKMTTPEVVRRVERSKTGLEVSGSLSGLTSFTSLLEADDCASAFPEPDPNIPGVTVLKEKRKRRKKVQQIGTTELDALAAQMNAEFEEAEEFDLIVE